MTTSRIIVGDALEQLRSLADESVQCCVTSPPYWGLRDYGALGQMGLEATPDEYIARMVEVFEEVRRVLRADGTLWLNIGDSYAGGGRGGGAEDCKQRTNVGSLDAVPNVRVAGLKPKDLVGVPWRLAFALQADGWWLRSDIIWAKPNPMPESVTDRPTKAHEYLFLLTKSARYYYDAEAIAEPHSDQGDTRRLALGNGTGWANADKNSGAIHLGTNGMNRNARTVWTIATSPFPEAHFATFPPELPRRCIAAGSKAGNTVLDPFAGAGTTGLVAHRLGRNFIGIELNPKYAEMARRRIHDDAPLLADVE